MNKVTTNKVWTGVKCSSKREGEFIVPVLRNEAADAAIKSANASKGSKFMKPTFGQGGGSYQASQKKGIF